MTCHIFRDPADLVDGIRERERREAKLLAGTGCDSCQHAAQGFGLTVCGINQTHPRCVFRGRYVRVE